MAEFTPEELRIYIKDTPAMNKIFAGVEFGDKDYERAVQWGKEKIAIVPPYIEDFPSSVLPKELQRIGALSSLFESAALFEIRNQSNLSEQGIPVPVGENASMYERLADKYDKKFWTQGREFKISYNMYNAFAYQSGVYGPLDSGR